MPTAPCYGTSCPKRGHCVHYAEVERPGEQRVVLTCRTPEGRFPLFEDRAPRVAAPVDGDGSDCD